MTQKYVKFVPMDLSMKMVNVPKNKNAKFKTASFAQVLWIRKYVNNVNKTIQYTCIGASRTTQCLHVKSKHRKH